MEDIQREILCVLLERLCDRGLLSRPVCSGTVELAHSVKDIPALLQRPAYPGEEGTGIESAPGAP